jgi:hypothetical protein
MSKRAKKAQGRILGEIQKQLILQAERWGRKGYYTPLKLEEMELSQCRKITGELLAEKANLEYELFLLDSNKRDVLIKLERLESYLKKASRVVKRHEKDISKMLDKIIGDKQKLKKAFAYVEPRSFVSVLISDN